jgi:polysaccharide biosynthesis/export protein
MGRSAGMRAAAFSAILALLALAACSTIPAAGPLAGSVAAQAQPQPNGRVLFDVVLVDNSVVATLLAEPPPSFPARFKEYAAPPDLRIAVGDTLSVLLWETGAGQLLEASPPPPAPLRPGPALPVPRIDAVLKPLPYTTQAPPAPFPMGLASGATTIPMQLVQSDGTITVPYAERIAAAGRTPLQVQQEIEAVLADKALQPQALVIDEKSPANSVSTSGDMLLKGGLVRLAPGGERLLQVIAAAGGARAPVRDVFVRLSRGDVTATIPLQTLVSEPAEDVYAAPGDTLTLIEVPQTFAIFGAASRNAAIQFPADRLSLAEALALSKGLNDNLANPKGVFLFRWEHDRVVRALGEPIADGAPAGLSPVAYRFDLEDANSNLLAQQFPVQDKDVIFVADADIEPLRKVFEVVGTVVGPFRSALLVCHRANC